jgi:DNA invertase Pin-like site-specific DNA recombinase
MCKAVEEFAERLAAERIAEGRAEGRAEGEARGRRDTMLATAMRMLKDGVLALKDVARYSGLSLAQVKKLQAERASV